MVDGVITYLNTDLDLVSTDDLTELAEVFKSQGVYPLHVTHGGDGLWYSVFEASLDQHEPESHISKMLSVIEQLSPELRMAWEKCSLRVFDLGYDCGLRPWAYNQGLSTALLARIAAAGATLRITIYPETREENQATAPNVALPSHTNPMK